SRITGPSAASAGGTRVVFPAPGAAVTTAAREERTAATIRSMWESIGSELITTVDTADTGEQSFLRPGFHLISSAPSVVESIERRGSVRRTPQLLQPRVAAAADAVHVVRRGVSLVVVLMIGLGRPEYRRRLHARQDTLEAARLLDRDLRALRRLLLCAVRVKDDRTILRSGVAELAGAVGGIGVVPVRVEKVLVGDLRGIVGDLHRLDVSRDAGLHLFVARFLRTAAGIPDGHRQHARQFVEHVLHAPEAAAGEDRCG